MTLAVEVGYSSTCPCSAALARQLVADGFAARFGTGGIDGAAARDWLREHASLATPLQTAVKRADEQAFARLNGANLMYVEDAARRVQAALAPHYAQAGVSVRHMESLHPHDAVAQAGVF